MLLNSAVEWYRNGIGCIPLHADSKIAAIKWREYQNRLPTLRDLARWFDDSNSYNIGVICGGGLTVIDFDTQESYESWLLANGARMVCGAALSSTFTVRTRRGYHCYFWCYNEVRTQLAALNNVDVKSNGGYVVGAGSVVDGHRYEIVNPGASILFVNDISEVLPQCEIQSGTPHPIRVPMDTGHGAAITPSSKLYRGVIADIKRSLPLLSLVERYTPMRPSGDGCYIGSCPAHEDRHPSFRVVRDRCSCFVSGCKLHDDRAMDSLEFYSRLHGITYRESCLILATELGLLRQ